MSLYISPALLPARASACRPHNMCCLFHLMTELIFHNVFSRLFIIQQIYRTCKCRTCAWLYENIFRIKKRPHIFIQPLIFYCKFAAQYWFHNFAYKARRSSYRKPVCVGDSCKSDVLYANLIMKFCRHAQYHTRSLRWLHKNT